MKDYEFYELKCAKCSNAEDEKAEYTNCRKCGMPLEVSLNYGLLKERLNMPMIKSVPYWQQNTLTFTR